MSPDSDPAAPPQKPAEKVRSFPQVPGVYLMKDSVGRVIYVGKAKSLRDRAGSYFLKAAAEEPRTAHWIGEICDVDFIEAESEVDALLVESRLIKDIQPKYNKEQKDDKTFPYLEITTRDDFPRVAITREPRAKGTRLYGPFANVSSLRGALQVLQRIFKFRTCTLDIDADESKWQWFRPCLLASYIAESAAEIMMATEASARGCGKATTPALTAISWGTPAARQSQSWQAWRRRG